MKGRSIFAIISTMAASLTAGGAVNALTPERDALCVLIGLGTYIAVACGLKAVMPSS